LLTLPLRLSLALTRLAAATATIPASSATVLSLLETAAGFACRRVGAVVHARHCRGRGRGGRAGRDWRRRRFRARRRLGARRRRRGRCRGNGKGRRRIGRWSHQVGGGGGAFDGRVARFVRAVAIRIRLALFSGGTRGARSAAATGGTPAFVHAGAVGQGECSRVTRRRARVQLDTVAPDAASRAERCFAGMPDDVRLRQIGR
jgi:hypothetical protein